MSKIDSLVVISCNGRLTQLTGEKIENPTKKSLKKNPPIKMIFFSLLANYARDIGDNYWLEMFDLFSKKSLPRNFRFDGKLITYKQKSKILSLDINMYQDIGERYNMVNSGMISAKDSEKIEEYSFEKQEEIVWKNIKSSEQQIIFLRIFCKMKGKENNFNDNEIKAFSSFIISNVFTGGITSEHIKMKNGLISEISNLIMEENGKYRLQSVPVKIKREKSRKISDDTGTTLQSQGTEKYVFVSSKSLSNYEKKNI